MTRTQASLHSRFPLSLCRPLFPFPLPFIRRIQNYRTALIYAFHEAKIEMPPRWRVKLKRFFRGLRRKEAQERHAGERPLTVGKQSMPHRLYTWLCGFFIKSGNIFAWAYLTLAWGSIARTNNVADIRLAHMEPVNDALGLRQPKSKTDQMGLRANLLFQLFANPDDVRQCCVTALAALLLLDETHSSDKLFLGGSQEQRFRRSLQEALATDEGKSLLTEVGRTASSISAHSTRKGSAAYASNGTTHAPSFPSICLRAGWSLGGVLSRYFQHDASMDAFLGRILAGLDSSSLRFGVLPPHFAHDKVSDDLLLRCFPAHRERKSFYGVLRFVLPSLLHHREHLETLLPEKHRLRLSRLFTDHSLRASLEAHVVTGLDSPYLKATGIPPYIAILRQGAAIEATLERLVATAEGTPAVPLPTATDIAPTVSVPSVARTGCGFPIDFELPGVGAFTAWRLLLRGLAEEEVPPYRLLRPGEFSDNKKLRKRISDWHYFFNTMSAKLGGLDEATLARLQENDDETELTSLFARAWETFHFGEKGKTTARPDQWTLNTTVSQMRRATAREKTETPLLPEAENAPQPTSPRQLWTMPRKRTIAALFREDKAEEEEHVRKRRRIDEKQKKKKGHCDYSMLLQ